MRWFKLVLFIAVIAMTTAEPEPKKYKPEVKTKEKDAKLTDEEKKFLREVEVKFGIKTQIPLDNESKGDAETKVEDNNKSKSTSDDQGKAPFPAVIAIEIVNDTDDKGTPTKGKRTIDANLGYGYQTNNGYTYTYLGKQSQEKPKFMIYPYSQEDIPASNTNGHSSGYSYNSPHSSGSHSVLSSVQIMPSQAFEVVPSKEEQTGYNYEKPSVQLNTKYENVQSVEQPPPSYSAGESSYHQATPQTFYTTYNGQQFSGLSGQFPSVMSNYLVDSSQLLRSPQYQSAGLTHAHFHSHGSQQEQKVVPVLVLRVPSSYLKKPTAELYADAPHSVSQYLNVNLQELVNQYFKKLGYPYGPPVMAYQNPISHTSETQTSAPTASYEPHKYASPYVQPTYTHADQAGVQYSAVQPVMARYPSSYTRQQYYTARGHQYQQPKQQQQYMYRYKYVPQISAQAQSYYTQPQYQQAYQHAAVQAAQQTYSQQQPTADQETSHESAHSHGHDTASYSAEQPNAEQEEEVTSVEYEAAHSAAPSSQQYEQQTVQYEAPTATPQYETQTEPSVEYGPTKVPLPTHEVSNEQVEYEQPQSVEVYPRGQTGHAHPETDSSQTYQYQTQVNGHVGHEELPLSENYPSKDHTIATVLPQSYKSRQQSHAVVQTVSYVTPQPTMKYHAQYRVMVPQTVISRPTEGKASYVNSHSPADIYNQLRSSRYNAGAGRDSQHASGGKQRPSGYPWNYHTYLKRMVRPESKSDNSSKTVMASEKTSS